MIKIHMHYYAPFDFRAMLNYYKRHKMGNLERFNDDCYTRYFYFDNMIHKVVVTNDAKNTRLCLILSSTEENILSDVMPRIKKMFDVEHFPDQQNNSKIDSIVNFLKDDKFYGIRQVGCWDAFELAVSTILGQLISGKQALKLTDQLIENYGRTIYNPYDDCYIQLFPCAETLVKKDLDKLNIPKMKKFAIKALAQAVLSKTIDFSSYKSLSNFKKKLMMIKGIGRWSVEYIALRAMKDESAFPEGDAFLQKLVPDKKVVSLGDNRAYIASFLYVHSSEIAKILMVNTVNKVKKNNENNVQYQMIYASPVGNLKLIANDTHLLFCLWTDEQAQADKCCSPIIKNTLDQLDSYFAKKLTAFDLPIKLTGTSFQESVWQGLLKIPFAETWSYQKLAKYVGNPKAVRAVGSANGKNPLSIIVPCHRVVRANGETGGYIGGVDVKEKLLRLERLRNSI
ncbi:MAG: methylated-DNA--[protein]-cysteine S-methyltransferase [Francisellaceae bacterium]